MTSPADPGLQAERTSLAWRRTALSVAVGSLVGLRVLPGELGAYGYAVCFLGLGWSVDLAVVARRRHRDADLVMRRVGHRGPEGAVVARVALATAVTAAAALVGVLVIAGR